VTFWERSPLATAVVTRAISRTWSVRLAAIELTEPVRSRQIPKTPFTSACTPRWPSVPTSRVTRVSSAEDDLSWSTIEFTTVPMRARSPLAGRPSMVSSIFSVRSPSGTAEITRGHLCGRTDELVDQ
jgi:hypothetical protein